jgi:hypothetical protein
MTALCTVPVKSHGHKLYNPEYFDRLNGEEFIQMKRRSLSAYLMQFQHAIKDYTLAIDWFQCTLKGCGFESEFEEYKAGAFLLKKRFTDWGTTGNQQFSATYHVFRGNLFMGTLLVNPRKGLIDEDLSMFHADNEQLYTAEFDTYFKEFLGTFSLSFNNFTRLDVALDFESQPEILRFMQMAQTGEGVQVMGRKKPINCYGRDDYESNKFLSGISFGGDGNKKVVIYHKSDEIRSKNHKPYIVNFWEKAGLIKQGAEHDIMRLEVRMKRDELLRYPTLVYDEQEYSFSWENVFVPGFLNALAEKAMAGFFEFAIVNDRDKNRSRWERIQLINFDKYRNYRTEILKQTVKPMGNHVTRYKRLLKSLYREFLNSGDTDYSVNMAKTAKEYGLNQFVQDRLKYWHESIEKEMKYDPGISEEAGRKAFMDAKELLDTREFIQKHSWRKFEDFEMALRADTDPELNGGNLTNRYFTGMGEPVEYIHYERPPF